MTASMPAGGSVERILERQEQQRRAGVGVLSCLAGPISLGIARWRRWCDVSKRPILVLADPDPKAAVRQWTAALSSGHDLPRAAAAILAAKTGRSLAEMWATLSGMSVHDRKVFLDGFALGSDGAVEACCRWLLTRNLAEALDPDCLTAAIPAHLPVERQTWADVVRLLSQLLPETPLPALLFVPGGDAASYPMSAARLLSALVECVPRVPVGLAIEATVLDRCLSQAPESHALALLRDGRISLVSLDEATIRRRLAAQGLPFESFQCSIGRLATDGADELLADAFAEVVRRPQPPRGEEGDAEARSAAERFLFELLEIRPRTAGLFALNAGLGFPFGRNEAEADLCARSLRLVIELDGYYHFQDTEAYRRDRRKDWEMQRRGFVVLRFLSDDVAVRLEEILDTIEAAVDHCREHSDSQRKP